MRRLVAILLLLCFLLGLSACRSSVGPELFTTTPAVFTTQQATEPAETVTEAVHIHIFSDATCTDPRICDCGETEGRALGHSWEPATCIAPKTCANCGSTSGNTAGHNYIGNTCSVCGKASPDSSSDDMVWIPTKGGTKYHSKSSCSNMIDPEKVTLEDAEDRGFAPCKRCYK